MSKIFITGGKPLQGVVHISGSKNAALPIISACLLSNEVSILHNVPDIADIRTMIEILEFLECKINFEVETLTIDPRQIKNHTIPHYLVDKMRGSIILLAPLLVRFKEVKLAFPGGCVLGKRPIDAHLHAFKSLGAIIIDDQETIHIKTSGLVGDKIVMTEMSVTATENVIMAACMAKGESEIKLCAAEPHVQDLCLALNQAGANITGIGIHNLFIKGVPYIKPLHHNICPDYLEVGTYAIATAITKGHVIIKNAKLDHLDSFWQKMAEAGVKFIHKDNEIEIFPTNKLTAVNIRTAVFPSFPTDLQAQFAILLTQAEGPSIVFETLFEGKMNYIFELEKMGAKVALLNNYQAKIIGPTQLKGTAVASLDIRAGAAIILAALVASGESEIANIYYIDRGYSKLVEKLQLLGANISREN